MAKKKPWETKRPEYKIDIPANEVDTALAQAFLAYKREWAWHIHYDDFMRVKMQLWAWMNQLNAVHDGAFKEDVTYNDQILDSLKSRMDKNRLGKSNPYADFVAERFEHT